MQIFIFGTSPEGIVTQKKTIYLKPRPNLQIDLMVKAETQE